MQNHSRVIRCAAVAAILMSASLSSEARAQSIDHFRMYSATGPDGPIVNLVDQFQGQVVDLGPVVHFMVPADKNGEGLVDFFSHLACYAIPEGQFAATVVVSNQFGAGQSLTVTDPDSLCVPTENLITPGPVNIDHYKCYLALGSPVDVGVLLTDQFQVSLVLVVGPSLFCNPVDKNGEGIANPVDHLTCYTTFSPGGAAGPIPIANQFHPLSEVIDVAEPSALCVPSSKDSVVTTTTSTTTTSTTSTTLPALCGGSPIVGCKGSEAGKSQLQIKLEASDASKNQLKFKYKKGDATLLTEFSDPVSGSADYRLCIWDGSVATQPLFDVAVLPGGTCGTKPCWKATGTKGFKFKDKTGTPDGIQQVKLKADGTAGKTQVKVKAKGLNLSAPTLPLTTTVTAQFVADDGSVTCWEVSMSTTIKNDAVQFKAKGD